LTTVGQPGQQEPPHRPVDDRYAAGIARANDQIEVVSQLVGVHLEHQLVVMLERVPKPLDVRRSQAKLARTVDDVDSLVMFCQRVDDLSGTVGRRVVDDENLQPLALRQDLVYERLHVLPLVVGRDDDEGVTHRDWS
jgi:hypothetical protein